jgi:hypothetical protein
LESYVTHDLPSWQNPDSGGTMKRIALWLVAEVGEGGIFTKAQLRDAFPDASQADRRLRDLRDFGWKIDTNREDAGLDAHEQRFVQRGTAVWEPGKATRPTKADAPSLNAAERREVFNRDGNYCRSCGITPGQEYAAGTYETAQLDIARRMVRREDGSDEVQFVTECKRCRIGGRAHEVDLTRILTHVRQLGGIEQKMFAKWVGQGTREFSRVERLWAEYQSLPAESRGVVAAQLDLMGHA